MPVYLNLRRYMGLALPEAQPHPELRRGERFYSNVEPTDVPGVFSGRPFGTYVVHLRDWRLGEVAYDAYGNIVSSLRPLFTTDPSGNYEDEVTWTYAPGWGPNSDDEGEGQ